MALAGDSCVITWTGEVWTSWELRVRSRRTLQGRGPRCFNHMPWACLCSTGSTSAAVSSLSVGHTL